jgi:hypothetical protein
MGFHQSGDEPQEASNGDQRKDRKAGIIGQQIKKPVISSEFR